MTAGARTALVLGLILVALASTSIAQTGEYRVVEVDVEGNRVATRSLILGVSSIAKGSPLTPQIIQTTLQRLYGLGLFSDVRIEADEIPGGLHVFIVVKELPKLAALNIRGNNKISTKDLRQKLALGVGGYISPYLIHTQRQKLLDTYAEKGYFQATADVIIEYSTDSSEATLTFDIEERSKVKVQQVVMTGNQRVEGGDLIKKMRNRKRGFLKSSDFDKEKYAEDLEKVIEEYHKKGHIDAYLISDSMTIDSANIRMTIFLEVYEGPRYYFGNAEFTGNEILDTVVLARSMKFKPGNVFSSEKYQESLYGVYSAYQEVGHLHVRVLDERVTRSDSTIDVKYTISEGLPSHINLVKITGNGRTKDHVIRREMSVRPGQVFNRTLLIRSIRDIMALNFFGNVEPVPIDLPSGDVDIEFKVEEKQTGQVSAGGGYNSTDKLVGSLGMGIPNFRGNGQNLSFSIEFGSRRSSFSLSFTEPWLFGRPTLLGADLFAINRRWYDEYTESRQGASLRLGRRLRWPDNYFRVVGAVRMERYRYHDYDDDFEEQNRRRTTYSYRWTSVDTVITTDPTPDTSVVVRRNSQDDVVLGDALPGSVVAYEREWNRATRVSFTVTRDSHNLPEFATDGSIFSYSFEHTGGILGGFWKYQRHQVSFARFFPLIGNIALATKIQYGTILAGSDDPYDRRILISDRFNPGGTAYDGTVRGYDDGSLTPDSTVAGSVSQYYYYADPDSVNVNVDEPDSISTSSSFTTRVRGKYMLVANAEIQIPLVKQQIYGLLFFDAGNSWLHLDDIKPITGLYKGIGVGFRVLVPGIGTLGFDFAKPLDDPPDGDDRSWKPHFQIGTTIR